MAVAVAAGAAGFTVILAAHLRTMVREYRHPGSVQPPRR